MNKIVSGLLFLAMMLHACMAGQFSNYTFAGRENWLYVPTASGTASLPLFVMLHGCQQNATDFAVGTKMNSYAESNNFFVIYPEQPASANIIKCWNWFDPANQARGAGEPALIVSIVQSLIATYNIDSSKIYVGGLSAGGAMTVILGVTYPDIFRGVAVGAALSALEAFTVQASGGPDPVAQGLVAYNAMGSFAQTLKVLVVHGTADAVVAPINGQQVVTSFITTLDYVIGNGTANGVISNVPTTNTSSQVVGGKAYDILTYSNSITGETLIQYVIVDGMAHAWSGGNSSGFTDPEGPDASSIMVSYLLSSSSSTTTTTSSSTTSSNSTLSTSTTSSSSTTTSPASSVRAFSVSALFILSFIYCLYL